MKKQKTVKASRGAKADREMLKDFENWDGTIAYVNEGTFGGIAYNWAGDLIWTDGRTIKPMTLRDTVEWVRQFEQALVTLDASTAMQHSPDGFIRWLGDITDALKVKESK